MGRVLLSYAKKNLISRERAKGGLKLEQMSDIRKSMAG